MTRIYRWRPRCAHTRGAARSVFGVGVLVVLTGAAPAQAGKIEDALAVADKVHPTACKPLRFERTDNLANPGASAEASDWPCVMRVTTSLDSDRSWAEFCSIIVHERGHNAGLGHSLDPRSNMHEPLPGHMAPPHAAACGPSDNELVRREAMHGLIQDIRADVRWLEGFCVRSRGRKLTKCRRDLRTDKRRLRKLRVRYAKRVARAPRFSRWQ